MAGLCTFTNVVLAIFFGYLALVGHQIYTLFNPESCKMTTNRVNRDCIYPLLTRDAPLQLRVSISASGNAVDFTSGETIWHVKEDFFMNSTHDHEVSNSFFCKIILSSIYRCFIKSLL